jgi:hypothetical protein
MNLTEGLLRVRYRDSWERPAPMVPGEVYAITIELFHGLRPLDSHRPSRCLHHHKPGARSQAGWRPRRAVDMDSNACRAGEVERKVWRDNDSLLLGQSAVSTQRKRRATAMPAVRILTLEQHAPNWPRRLSHCVLDQARSPQCHRGCAAQFRRS